MHRDRWESLKEIYHAVLERPEGERPAFLEEACGNDDDLRAQIEAMLEARDDTSTVFKPMVRRSDTATARAPGAPKRIGRYEIGRVIGTGGMGIVYEAVQDHPHRVVALKVMRHGVASPAAMKRFQHEAEILGHLQHPGIAQIYEAGTFDEGEGGQPYFAMELIRGRPLIEHAEAQQLGARDRLTLFAEVCEAVQYAHRKGVIHRDLKPGNILVDENGEPKILDFGVARATDSDIQTTTLKTDIGQLIGTIPYMSPEQVSGDPRQLDTRSDVYSLGVVLYELLAGRLPYNLKERTIPEAVRIIREEEPTPLSSVNRIYRGDLDTIVAKALQKDRTRRYQSASDLASDIRRYLSDQPILARPPSVAYQLRKFAQRNKAFVGGVTAVFVVLVGGIVTTSVALARESEQRSLAQQREQQAEVARAAEAEARDEAQQRQQEAEVALEQARRQATKAAVINEFLTEIITAPDPLWDLSEPDPTRRSGPDLTIAEATLDVLPLIDEAFRGYPDAEADTRLAIGRSFVGLSHFTQARKQLTHALALFIDLYGEEDARTRDCQRVLGRALGRLGKSLEAERLTTRSLNSCRRLLGEEHPETLLAKMELAQLLMDDYARAPEAVALCREVLESPGAAARAGSWIELQAQGQLAFALRVLFQMTEAVQLGRATLEALISRGAGESGLAIFLRIVLGNCAMDMGDPVLAETYHRETLALSLRLVGADSFMTAITRQIMASALVAQGRWAEAESVARMAYETHRKTLGEQQPYTKVTQLRVFISQIGQRPDDPDPWRQLKNLIDAGIENLAPEALQPINSLTRFFIDQGRLDDARTLFDWGSKFKVLALEFPRPEPYESMVLRARLECLSGRHEQGVKLLREARTQAAARLPEWNFSQVAQQAFCACEMKLDQLESAAHRLETLLDMPASPSE